MRAVQFHTKEYLEYCRSMKPEQIVRFLDDFRRLHGLRAAASGKSRLISLKVPEELLEAFRLKARAHGVPYQTQIKTLMREWLERGVPPESGTMINDR